MVKALVFGTKDCAFESHRGRDEMKELNFCRPLPLFPFFCSVRRFSYLFAYLMAVDKNTGG